MLTVGLSDVMHFMFRIFKMIHLGFEARIHLRKHEIWTLRGLKRPHLSTANLEWSVSLFFGSSHHRRGYMAGMKSPCPFNLYQTDRHPSNLFSFLASRREPPQVEPWLTSNARVQLCMRLKEGSSNASLEICATSCLHSGFHHRERTRSRLCDRRCLFWLSCPSAVNEGRNLVEVTPCQCTGLISIMKWISGHRETVQHSQERPLSKSL